MCCATTKVQPVLAIRLEVTKYVMSFTFILLNPMLSFFRIFWSVLSSNVSEPAIFLP